MPKASSEMIIQKRTLKLTRNSSEMI